MSGPWIAVVVVQGGAIITVGVVPIGLLRRVLPLLDARPPGTAPMPTPINVPVQSPLPEFEAVRIDGTPMRRALLLG